MHVFVNRPCLLADLQDFLRDLGFVATNRRGDGLDVAIQGAPDNDEVRRVVNVYRTIWQAIHPGVRASILEQRPATRVRARRSAAS